MNLLDRGLGKEAGGFQIDGADNLEGHGNHHLQAIHHLPIPVVLGDGKPPDDDELPPRRLRVPTPIGRQSLKGHRVELSALLIELKILLHYLSRRVAQRARLGRGGICSHPQQQRREGRHHEERRSRGNPRPIAQHRRHRSQVWVFNDACGKNHRGTAAHSIKRVLGKHAAARQAYRVDPS